jgi:hypothetical protein
MSFTLSCVFSLSNGLAAILAAVRFRNLSTAFLPFVILLWAGFAAELGSLFIIRAGYSNAGLYNVFALAEGMLVLWQFNRWGAFTGSRWLHPLLQVFFCCVWLVESLRHPIMSAFNSYYILAYSFTIVLVSINLLTRQFFDTTGRLYLNPVFLICLAFIIYFLYATLMETFWLYGLQRSAWFRTGVQELLVYVNLFCNLLLAFAVLWIPTRTRYMLQW